jgi:hypothetical protein
MRVVFTTRKRCFATGSHQCASVYDGPWPAARRATGGRARRPFARGTEPFNGPAEAHRDPRIRLYFMTLASVSGFRVPLHRFRRFVAPFVPRSRAARALCALFVFALVCGVVPARAMGRNAPAYFEGDVDAQRELAAGCESWLRRPLRRGRFGTVSGRFDGEWMFATYMMSGMGFAQMAEEHPELAARHRVLVEKSVDEILTRESRAFEVEAWGTDPIDSLAQDRGHNAYLGYLNLLLSLERRVWPDNKHAALNDAITASLVRRLSRASIGLVESYPGEVFPIDNTALFGSIGLYDKATGAHHEALLSKLFARLDAQYTDPRTGMLYQLVDPRTGAPVDAPRASGTALGAYFVSFASEERAKKLDEALAANTDTVLGFGAVKEYGPDVAGSGDVDSGPLVFGFGVTATGFSLATSRISGDAARFRSLYATTHLFGAPRDRDGARHFVSGGPVGDAILFAMLTAHGGRS